MTRRFEQEVDAAIAQRQPCPECGGKYVERWRRPYHAFTCSRNPIHARRFKREPAPDPDTPEACPVHPTEPKWECRACEVLSERDWEERQLWEERHLGDG